MRGKSLPCNKMFRWEDEADLSLEQCGLRNVEEPPPPTASTDERQKWHHSKSRPPRPPASTSHTRPEDANHHRLQEGLRPMGSEHNFPRFTDPDQGLGRGWEAEAYVVLILHPDFFKNLPGSWAGHDAAKEKNKHFKLTNRLLYKKENNVCPKTPRNRKPERPSAELLGSPGHRAARCRGREDHVLKDSAPHTPRRLPGCGRGDGQEDHVITGATLLTVIHHQDRIIYKKSYLLMVKFTARGSL